MRLRDFFLLLAALSGSALALPASAEEARGIDADEMSAKRGRAQGLTAQARELRKSAEAVYQEDAVECRKSVLVNNCLARARDRRLEKVEIARSLEMDAGFLESEVRRFQLTERRIKRAKRMAQTNLPTTVTVEGAGPVILQGAKSGAPVPSDASAPAAKPIKAE